MKIADFFVQITAKGDLKELKAVIEYQKALQAQAKVAVANAKVKVAELKKETAEIQKQKKVKNEEPKTLKDVLMARGRIFSQQNKMNMLMAKGILQTIGLTGATMAFVGAMITAGVAVDRMVTKLAQANQLYSNFQRQTGLPMGRALGVAGAMANVDITMTPEEVMQNMKNLQSNLIGVQFGMGNIAPYQMAGINPWGANSADMLDVIRKQLRGFAPAYRTFLLQQMGLDPRLGSLIDLSDTEYLKYKKESLELYLSPADRKTIQELTPEWNKVNLKFAKGWEKITMMLSRDFIGLAKILADLWLSLIDVLNVINTVLKPFFDILTVILRPIYYLLDDLMGFLIGKDSIIGRFIKGDKEGTEGALGVLFGANSKELARLTESIEDFHKFLDNTIIGKVVKGANYLLHPSSFAFDLLKNTIPNIFNHNDRNLSMNNDITVYANSSNDGAAIGSATSNAIYNMIIPQWQRGY